MNSWFNCNDATVYTGHTELGILELPINTIAILIYVLCTNK